MAVDQNQQSRRPHHHRGRRGPDRRGSDRRTTQSAEPAARSADQVDVEQIMRDIRSRIAQRHGIELSTQQIQELAARRLEAILDPRTINPSLMQQLRRGAGSAPDVPAATPESGYTFEATTLYESHRGLLRFFRKLLNPILKLFFNPNPLVHALHTQARLNREAAGREAERERTQTEWNALHYEIVQRLVTEVSRVSVEVQSLTLRLEALTARVDYNDRKVRALDTATPQSSPRPPARNIEQPVAAAPATSTSEAASGDSPSADAAQADGSRRRRRRRRGRRGGTTAAETGAATVVVGGSEGLAGPDSADLINGDEGDDEDADSSSGPVAVNMPEAARADVTDAGSPEPPSTGTAFEPAPPSPRQEVPGTNPPLPESGGFDEPARRFSEPEPVAESIPLGAHQPQQEQRVEEPATAATMPDPNASSPTPPLPEQPAPPPDEPSPRPQEPNPGPPDR
jgi:hypothetical protein